MGNYLKMTGDALYVAWLWSDFLCDRSQLLTREGRGVLCQGLNSAALFTSFEHFCDAAATQPLCPWRKRTH